MYLIPKNVGGKFEFFEGFGMKEMFYCLIGVAIGVGITFILSSFHSPIIMRILPIPIFTGAVFFAVKRDPRLGKSILSNIADQKKFMSKTQKYFYVYGEGRKTQ
jgi:hypothetical protein